MERGGGEMMDSTPEEVVGSKDLSNVMKGKRTKRQRPQSPIPFTIIAPSTSDNGNPNTNNSSSSNSNNNTAFSVTTSTDEDEDTARCLILLAQGQSREWPRTTIKESFVAPKFNSKRYIETPIAANGKAGMYVYECKTCSKTFPSFQALGGHRASHKKPRAMAEEKKPLAVMSDEEEEESNWRNNVSYSSLSLQLSARGGNCGNSSIVKSNSKVHECSICGTEFASGQALGGHMRRHRAVVGGGNNGLSLSPTSQVSMDVPAEELTRKRRNAFSLDLNLPAPEDDHHRDNNKLTFASKQRQNQQQQQQQQQSSALVLSAATNLVDCHF